MPEREDHIAEGKRILDKLETLDVYDREKWIAWVKEFSDWSKHLQAHFDNERRGFVVV